MSRASIHKAVAEAAQMNRLDRAISVVAPVWARNRMQARVQIALAGGYNGASRSRRATSEWRTSIGASADADLLPDLPTLRDRSRDSVRNNPIAGGAINTVVTNVVGTGLMLRAQPNDKVLGLSEDECEAWARNAEREFDLWIKTCDITRQQDFYEIQDLVLRSTLESGDIFVLTPMLKYAGETYALKLQLIEADRVSNPGWKADTVTMAGGVEMTAAGAPVRYHFTKQHPGAVQRASLEWDSVQAFGSKTGRRNVIHCFKRLRPGQTRGEPYLAPVMEPLKQIDRYTEAEIMAAVVSGMFTVFTHTETGMGIDPASMAPPAGATTESTESSNDIKLGNGAIVDLGINEKIETANPGRPNANFDPFVQAVLRQIGVRLELPFEVLIKHYTASYSAARAAILEAWRFFKVRRAWLAGKFCQPVYELFLEEAVSAGRISAPGFFADPLIRAAYCGAGWYGDGPGAIDPNKEVEAAKTRIEMGLTTLDSETAEYNGGDWQKNIAQRKREQAAAKDAGLLQPPAPATVIHNGPAPTDEGEYEDGAAAAAPRSWVFETDAEGRTRITEVLPAPAAADGSAPTEQHAAVGA